MEKYDLVKIVGQGSYGKALLCQRKADVKKCIIKQIMTSKLNSRELAATMQEATLLSKLRHPNVVAFWESFRTRESLCIVMEFADAGDLDRFLKARKGKSLNESEVFRFFIQITLAIKHIHDRKILHRDLKSQNIFLTSTGLIKLGDFGVSRVLRNTGELAATQIGTPYYMSPEIMDGKKYNSKTDIWSLGCILYEMMCLKLPFDGSSMRQLCFNIINATPTKPPSIYSLALQTLAVKEMLAKNPKQRPSANVVLAKDFLKDRITEFLELTGHPNELNHTVLHGVNIMTSTHSSSNTTASSVSDNPYVPLTKQPTKDVSVGVGARVESKVQQASVAPAAVVVPPKRPAVAAPSAPAAVRSNVYAPKPVGNPYASKPSVAPSAVNNNPYAIKAVVASKPKASVPSRVPSSQLSSAALKAQVDAKVAAIMAKAQQQVDQSNKYKIPSVKAPTPAPSAYRVSNANAAAAAAVPRKPSINQPVIQAEQASKPDPRYVLDSQYNSNNRYVQPPLPLKGQVNAHGQVKITDKHKNVFAFAANPEQRRKPDWVDPVAVPSVPAAESVPADVSDRAAVPASNNNNSNNNASNNIPSNVLDVWQRWKDNSDALDDQIKKKLGAQQPSVPVILSAAGPAAAAANANSNVNVNVKAVNKPPVSVFAFAEGPSAAKLSRPTITKSQPSSSVTGNNGSSSDTGRVISSSQHQPDLGLNLIGVKLTPSVAAAGGNTSAGGAAPTTLSSSNRLHIMQGTVNRLLTKAKDAIQAHCIKQAASASKQDPTADTSTNSTSNTNSSNSKQLYSLQPTVSNSAGAVVSNNQPGIEDDNDDDDKGASLAYTVSDTSSPSIASSVPTPTSEPKLSPHDSKYQSKLNSKYISPDPSPKPNNNWFMDLAKQMDALKSQVNQLQQETENKPFHSTPEYEQSGLFQDLKLQPNQTLAANDTDNSMSMTKTVNPFDLNQSKLFANITIQMKVLNARVEVIKQFAARNDVQEEDDAIAIDNKTMKVLLEEAHVGEPEGVAPAKKSAESKPIGPSSKLCSKESSNNKILMKKSWFSNLSSQMDALKSKVSHIQESQQQQHMFSPVAETEENYDDDENDRNSHEVKNKNIKDSRNDAVSAADMLKQQRKQEREKQQQDFRQFIRAKKEGLQPSPERGSSSSSKGKPHSLSGRRSSADGRRLSADMSSNALTPSPRLVKKSLDRSNSTKTSKTKPTSSDGISPNRRTGPNSGGAGIRDSNSSNTKSSNTKTGVSSSQSKSKVNSNSKSVKKTVKKVSDSKPVPAVSAAGAAGSHKVKTPAEVRAQRDAERIEMKKIIDERRQLLKMKKMISNNCDISDENDEVSQNISSHTATDGADSVLVPKQSYLEPQVMGSHVLSSSKNSSGNDDDNMEESEEDLLMEHQSRQRKLNRNGSTATSIGISQATTVVAGRGGSTNNSRDSEEDDGESMEESVTYALSDEAQTSGEFNAKEDDEDNVPTDDVTSPLIHFDSPLVTKHEVGSSGAAPSYFDIINMSNSKFKQAVPSEADVPSPPPLLYGGGAGATDLEYSTLFSQLQNVLAMPTRDSHLPHPIHKSPPRTSIASNHKSDSVEAEIFHEKPSSNNEEELNMSDSSQDSDAFDEDDEADYHGLHIATEENDDECLYPTDLNDEYELQLDDMEEIGQREDLILESYDQSSVSQNQPNEAVVTTAKGRPSIETMEKHFQLNLSPRQRNSGIDSVDMQMALGQTIRTTPVHNGNGQRGEGKKFEFKENDCNQQQPTDVSDSSENTHEKARLGQYLIDALGSEPFAKVMELLAKAYNDDADCEDDQQHANKENEEDEEDKLLQDIEKVVGVNGLQYLDDMLLYVTLD